MKKKKSKEDSFSTFGWSHRRINDPFQVIAEFFSINSITSYRKIIKTVLLAATSNKVYKDDQPGNLINYFQVLQSLVMAVHFISQHMKKSSIKISRDDIFDRNLFCSARDVGREWQCLPRALSLKEYLNPYLAFRKFFRYQSAKVWHENLQVILNAALVESDLAGDSISQNILPIYIHLTKLVEAAHLIDVREVTHVDGALKNRT